ncbi:MAG: hypothetical protein GX638_06210, partial [Crenarchaeota archaeon]|nr:hypothetical protein [Thermoproteota archaeon]
FKHAWRNSESFLVLKAFGVEDKYGSTITKALRNYLTDDEKDIKKIIGNNPKAYNKETLRVAQSTAWAAIRTVYYRQASVLLGAEYFSHPLRNLYNAKCILYDNHPYTRKMKLSSNDLRVLSSIGYNFQTQRYYQDINNFFKNFWQDCNKQDDNIFGVSTYDIDMPPFLAYAIERTEYHQNVIESAFKIREEAGVCELRKKLNNIYVNCDQDNMGKELRDFASELRDLKKHLQIYLGYEREKVGVTVKMISYDLTVPRFTTKPFYPHKPHLAFIRDVILELASASTMGRLLDKLYARKY